MQDSHPKFVKWAVVLGIVIVLNVFFAVLVSLVLPAPTYETYCPTTQVMPSYNDQQACVAAGGGWNGYPPDAAVAPTPPGAKPVTGYCDVQYTCRADFTNANDEHAKNAFIAFVVLGVLALLAGVLIPGSSIVSSGLSYGGVVTLVIGSVQYWGSADNWIRLGISAVALLALLYIGWKKFKD